MTKKRTVSCGAHDTYNTDCLPKAIPVCVPQAGVFTSFVMYLAIFSTMYLVSNFTTIH